MQMEIPTLVDENGNGQMHACETGRRNVHRVLHMSVCPLSLLLLTYTAEACSLVATALVIIKTNRTEQTKKPKARFVFSLKLNRIRSRIASETLHRWQAAVAWSQWRRCVSASYQGINRSPINHKQAPSTSLQVALGL